MSNATATDLRIVGFTGNKQEVTTTGFEIKGRGIRHVFANTYSVTDAAWEKLAERYTWKVDA